MPFALVVLLTVWSLIKKEKWVMPAFLGMTFSCGPLLFMAVREQLLRYGNFEVGFQAGMYASLVATLPLAAFGWFLGKKLSTRIAVALALLAIASNYAVVYSYQYMVMTNAEVLKAEVPFKCEETPYHCAIRDNRLGDIAELKKQGKDIEKRDFYSRSPLWYAISNEEAVRVLLENGANPDSFNLKNETPLAFVTVLSLKPNLRIAEMLIKHGANINRTIGFRKRISLLNLAIINGNPDVINFALENGADPNYIDQWKKSPCVRMWKMKNKEQIKNLDKYCPDFK